MIMDDNRIMEAAKLIANSSAALIQAIGMMSENIERANRGESVDGVDVYYDQISEVVYLAKVILEEMEEKDHGESS